MPRDGTIHSVLGPQLSILNEKYSQRYGHYINYQWRNAPKEMSLLWSD